MSYDQALTFFVFWVVPVGLVVLIIACFAVTVMSLARERHDGRPVSDVIVFSLLFALFYFVGLPFLVTSAKSSIGSAAGLPCLLGPVIAGIWNARRHSHAAGVGLAAAMVACLFALLLVVCIGYPVGAPETVLAGVRVEPGRTTVSQLEIAGFEIRGSEHNMMTSSADSSADVDSMVVEHVDYSSDDTSQWQVYKGGALVAELSVWAPDAAGDELGNCVIDDLRLLPVTGSSVAGREVSSFGSSSDDSVLTSIPNARQPMTVEGSTQVSVESAFTESIPYFDTYLVRVDYDYDPETSAYPSAASAVEVACIQGKGFFA